MKMRKQFSGGIPLRLCSLKLVAATILVLVLGTCPSLTQLPTGTILGVVKDASGAAVPGAQVSVTNVDINDVRTTTTGSDGAFRVPALRPGRYSVKVEQGGFKTFNQPGIT